MVVIPIANNFPIQWGIHAPFMVGGAAMLISDPNLGEILNAIERKRVGLDHQALRVRTLQLAAADGRGLIERIALSRDRSH